jgi:hypothetical protein
MSRVVAALAVAALTACSGSGEDDGMITDAQRTTATAAIGTSTGPTSCRYETLFAALAELRGVRAMCPGWLPAGVQATSLFARSTPPEYVVEFNPPNELFPHVVLQLAVGDAPGRPVTTADVNGKHIEVYFEQAEAGAAGLHSSHYIAVVPGSGTQRGAYWVSLHQDSRRSRSANVEELLGLVRSMRPSGG